MRLLMPIDQDCDFKLWNGEKRYVFSKRSPKRKVNSMLFYLTGIFRIVVAEAEIYAIIEGTPEEVWRLTQIFAGITREQYDKYFSNSKTAIAFKLGNFKEFKEAKGLEDYGIKAPPRSWVYVR